MVIKRFTSILGSKRTTNGGPSTSPSGGSSILDRFRSDSSGGRDDVVPNVDTPEGNVARGVRLFCESGGPDSAVSCSVCVKERLEGCILNLERLA